MQNKTEPKALFNNRELLFATKETRSHGGKNYPRDNSVRYEALRNNLVHSNVFGQ